MILDSRRILSVLGYNKVINEIKEENPNWRLRSFGDFPLTQKYGLAKQDIFAFGMYYSINYNTLQIGIMVNPDLEDLHFNSRFTPFIIDTIPGILDFVDPLPLEAFKELQAENARIPARERLNRGLPAYPSTEPEVKKLALSEVNADNLEMYLAQLLQEEKKDQ